MIGTHCANDKVARAKAGLLTKGEVVSRPALYFSPQLPHLRALSSPQPEFNRTIQNIFTN